MTGRPFVRYWGIWVLSYPRSVGPGKPISFVLSMGTRGLVLHTTLRKTGLSAKLVVTRERA